jgi:hypothetical protein
VFLLPDGQAQLLFQQPAQQGDQALTWHKRQLAPRYWRLAAHAGGPAISQVPTTRCRQVLAAFRNLSKSLLERFLRWGIEKNFGFLKDDQIVNALFLKRPERIEALGLILLIALLIWRLMDLVMRSELQARQATVPGWDNKPTARPTAYMVTWKFKGILILCLGTQRRLVRPLTDTQLAFLHALQVPASCFTQASP